MNVTESTSTSVALGVTEGDDGFVPVTNEMEWYAAQHRLSAEELDFKVRAFRTSAHARALATEAEARDEPPVLTLGRTLTEEMRAGIEPVTYAIDLLHPSGGNVLVGAPFKTGKSTLLSALGESLVDGEPFLGEFGIPPLVGNVGFWNYEMSRDQLLAWVERLGIRNTDRLVFEHLRGRRLDLTTDKGEDEAVAWLERNEVTFWIIDTFRRAYRGQSSNDNDDVGRFTEALDVIKERAGVTELVISAHFGREQFEEGQEHVRGATELDDWADARWILTKERSDHGDSEARFFSANGRDVSVPSRRLSFDAESGRLSMVEGSRAAHREASYIRNILVAVSETPGIGVNDLREAIGGKRDRQLAHIKTAAQAGYIERRPLGPGRTTEHHLTPKGEELLSKGWVNDG